MTPLRILATLIKIFMTIFLVGLFGAAPLEWRGWNKLGFGVIFVLILLAIWWPR